MELLGLEQGRVLVTKAKGRRKKERHATRHPISRQVTKQSISRQLAPLANCVWSSLALSRGMLMGKARKEVGGRMEGDGRREKEEGRRKRYMGREGKRP